MRSEEVDGFFTGELVGNPLHGPEKMIAIQNLASTSGLDLSQSSAYSDSVYDLPMLEAVGHANVVNGDRQLRAHARSKGWRQYDFRKLRHARRFGLQAGFVALTGVFLRRARRK